MKRALQLLGGTVVGVVLAEGLFWITDDGAFPHLNVYEADTTLGARLRPGASQRVAFGGNPVTSVRINAEGFRGADWGPAQEGEIVVLGDSQVFGLGVEEGETASAALGAATGRPVRNAGIPTHGPPEYLAVLDALLARRTPKTAVLVLNFSNDLFEANTPNTARHAVWDGWAVRLETAPADVTNFPGRQYLFSQSHLVHAARRAWWTPPEAWEQGVASEGTWADVAGLAAARPPPGPPAEDPFASNVRELSSERWGLEFQLLELYTAVFPEAVANDGDLAVEGAIRHAHPGDIVGQSYAESSRAITVTAEQLRQGAKVRRELEGRLAEWVASNPDHSLARHVTDALAEKASLDAALVSLATKVPESTGPRSPLLPTVAAAKARCDAAGAELLVVALPLDVQVSESEWAKYGAEPRDMTETRLLLTDLVRDAESLGVRALDATDALAAAQPGAFLDKDLHMTPKGQAALGAAIAAKLAVPAPLALPGPGLPAGRSRVPTWEELALGKEVVVRGSSKNHCSTRALREWLIVDCQPAPGALTPQGVVVRAGEETLVGGDPGEAALLVTPLVPGRPVSADFVWSQQTERLTVAWEGETPRMAFAPAAAVSAPAPARCAKADDADRHGLYRAFGVFDRGCDATFPADCDAWFACGTGTRAALPTCGPGEANAGSAGHCHTLCDATRPCATGTCVDWQGGSVCL